MSKFRKLVENVLKEYSVSLQEEEPYVNMDEIDNLMSEYERAESDYHAADFYDDNYSWKSSRNSAYSRMKEINSKLKELTGKNYNELMNELGSKTTDEDKGPKFKVGDIIRDKDSKIIYEVLEVKKEEISTRNNKHTLYIYDIKNLYNEYHSGIYDENDYVLATNEDIQAWRDHKQMLQNVANNAPYKIGDKVINYEYGWEENPFEIYDIIGKDGTYKGDPPYVIYFLKDTTKKYGNKIFTSKNSEGWKPLNK